MIDRLTPEQASMLPAYRDEWLRIGLSCEPIDRDEARRAIAAVYAAAGLPAPAIHIFLASPLQGAIGSAQVRAQVGDQVRDQVRDQVGDQVWAQVRAQVGDQVWAQVRAQVRDQVRAQVWDQVRDQVRAQVGDQVRAACFGAHDADWLGFYAFFRDQFGLAEATSGLAEAARTCGWFWPFERLCIITDRPAAICFDDARRLHCETGPAITYRDGFSVYAWHGTRVPADWIENRSTLDPAEILRHENVEMRAVGASIIGWPRMLSVLKAKVIDHDPDPQRGDLIELVLPGLREPGRFLRAECPRNGLIVEGVPLVNEMDGSPINTVLAAQAWRVLETPATFEYPAIRT